MITTRTRWIGLAGLLLAAGAGPARAQDSVSSFDVELYANLTTVSVMVTLQGDADGDATAAVQLRPVSGSWAAIHPGVRIAGGRLATAAFDLQEGTAYEVEVTVSDPDGGGGTDTEQVTTRSVPTLPGSGTEYFVDPKGSDGGAGTSGDPFQTIAHAVAQAGPGDTVTVRDGVYREAITIDKLDASADPLWVRAENPGGAAIDGSDETIWTNPGGDLWTDEGGGVYSTPVAAQVGYVASDGAQLYHYESMGELQGETEGVHEGYFWDGATLYARVHDDSDPDTHQMAVGVRDRAFAVWYSRGVVIEGFEIRYHGSGDYPMGIYLRSSSDCVVRGCTLHHNNDAIFVSRTDAHRNLIEGNVMWDTGIWDWPWSAVKGSFHEASGVGIQGGEGNVVRDNVIHGIFNGVYIGNFSNDMDETESPYTDVHHNWIYEIGDDPLEPEGAIVQVKLWGNRVEDALMGVSLAPINVGPLWIHHNSFWRTMSSGLKLNNTPVGPMQVYHNTFYTDLSEANCITTGSNGWSNVTTRNNIFYGTRYVIEDTNVPGPGNDWDWDLLYSTVAPTRFVKWDDDRYYTLAEFQGGTGQEMNGIEAEPQLTDPGNADLTLTKGSPAVDAGTPIPGINDGYDGKAPDLGATELGDEPPGPQGDDDDVGDDDGGDDDGGDDDGGDDDGGDDDGGDDDTGGDDDDVGPGARDCSCRLDRGSTAAPIGWTLALVCWGLLRRGRV